MIEALIQVKNFYACSENIYASSENIYASTIENIYGISGSSSVHSFLPSFLLPYVPSPLYSTIDFLLLILAFFVHPSIFSFFLCINPSLSPSTHPSFFFPLCLCTSPNSFSSFILYLILSSLIPSYLIFFFQLILPSSGTLLHLLFLLSVHIPLYYSFLRLPPSRLSFIYLSIPSVISPFFPYYVPSFIPSLFCSYILPSIPLSLVSSFQMCSVVFT